MERAISACSGGSGGPARPRESASPASTVSGVRRSWDRAPSSELRRRSDSMWTSASWATAMKCNPFHGDGHQGGAGFQQALLFRCGDGLGAVRHQRQHAAGAHGRFERHVMRFADGRVPVDRPADSLWSRAHWAMPDPRRQRRRALTGRSTSRLSRLKSAARALNTRPTKRALMSAICSMVSALDSSRAISTGRGCAARGAPPPPPELQPGGELADHQRHDQHHREGEQVLHVGHGEVMRGGTKKKSNAATDSSAASRAGPRPRRVAANTTASRNSISCWRDPRSGAAASPRR